MALVVLQLLEVICQCFDLRVQIVVRRLLLLQQVTNFGLALSDLGDSRLEGGHHGGHRFHLGLHSLGDLFGYNIFHLLVGHVEDVLDVVFPVSVALQELDLAIAQARRKGSKLLGAWGQLEPKQRRT